ncbi:MAG: hypothetical protein HY077_05035 [Elusimicrobia bacterium]|nr:hypothetical protein [Elusimicrobiota bacterium]
MEEQKPAVKVALGLLGFLAILSGLLCVVLGLAAWYLSHQRTGTEGLAVLAAVFVQWCLAVFGGYILGGSAAAQGGKAARVGVFLNFGSVALTALALICHYRFAR